MHPIYDGKNQGDQIIAKKAKILKNSQMLVGDNLGYVSNSRCGCACLRHAITLITKTTKLKVENLSLTTFRFSLINICPPQVIVTIKSHIKSIIPTMARHPVNDGKTSG
jgi:hypothetical protein